MRRTIRGGVHWVTKCVSKHGENGPCRKNVPWTSGLRTGSLGIREIFADYRCAWRRFKENKRRRRRIVVKAKVEK